MIGKLFSAPLLALLAACASAEPEARALRIAAWNIEHLAEADGAGCRPRTQADYAALRAYAESLEADVIAFQEVESAAAAARVFDPARYTIVIEQRQGSGRQSPCRGLFGQILTRQATGFAVRNDLLIEQFSDVTALQLGDPDLRSGVDIRVRIPGEAPIRLLSVHLKSGCAAGASADACQTLLRQIPVLEDWIDARAAAGERFAVMGDFNRRLALSDDPIWADLNDGAPAALALASGEHGAGCDPRYDVFIDYIIVAFEQDTGNFNEWRFEGARLSDHCAISIDIETQRPTR